MYICCTDYLESRFAEEISEPVNAENSEKSSLLIYPNPNNGNEVILEYKLKNVNTVTQISVFNSLGIEVYSLKADKHASHSTLSLSFLPPGVYIIHIANNAESLSNKLLIVK